MGVYSDKHCLAPEPRFAEGRHALPGIHGGAVRPCRAPAAKVARIFRMGIPTERGGYCGLHGGIRQIGWPRTRLRLGRGEP